MKDKKLLFHSAKLLFSEEFKEDINDFRKDYFKVRDFDEDFLKTEEEKVDSFLNFFDIDENDNFLRNSDIKNKLGFMDVELPQEMKNSEIFRAEQKKLLKKLSRELNKTTGEIIKDLYNFHLGLKEKEKSNENASYSVNLIHKLKNTILAGEEVEGYEEYNNYLNETDFEVEKFKEENLEYFKFGDPIVGYKPDKYIWFSPLENKILDKYNNILEKWNLNKYQYPFSSTCIIRNPLQGFIASCIFFGIDVILDYYIEVFFKISACDNDSISFYELIYDKFFFNEEGLILDRVKSTDYFLKNIVELIDENPQKAKEKMQEISELFQSETAFIYLGRLPKTKKKWSKIYEDLKKWGYPIKSNKQIKRFMRGLLVYKKRIESDKDYYDIALDLNAKLDKDFQASHLRNEVSFFKKLSGIKK